MKWVQDDGRNDLFKSISGNWNFVSTPNLYLNFAFWNKTSKHYFNIARLSGNLINYFLNYINVAKKTILPFNHYTALEKALPEKISKQIPDQYSYLWVKASQCLGLGFELFRKRDALKHPLVEWESPDLLSGVDQIVNKIAGITPELYITQPGMDDAEVLMMTFHFAIDKVYETTNNKGEQIHRLTCRHIVLAQDERSPYIFNLFFKFSEVWDLLF